MEKLSIIAVSVIIILIATNGFERFKKNSTPNYNYSVSEEIISKENAIEEYVKSIKIDEDSLLEENKVNLLSAEEFRKIVNNPNKDKSYLSNPYYIPGPIITDGDATKYKHKMYPWLDNDAIRASQ